MSKPNVGFGTPPLPSFGNLDILGSDCLEARPTSCWRIRTEHMHDIDIHVVGNIGAGYRTVPAVRVVEHAVPVNEMLRGESSVT